MSIATLDISSPDGASTATFAPAAGMVCCSLRHGGEELLDLGRGLDAYAERGNTMGIPLLYPWANRLAEFSYEAAGRGVVLPEDPQQLPHDPNGLPIHGLIPRLMPWEASLRGSTLTARLEWGAEQLLALYPYRHEVELQAEIATGALTVTVLVRATGQDSVPISFGFHPYLRLPSSLREDTEVTLPACERLLLDERSIPTGAREALGPTAFELAQTSWDDGLSVSESPARFTSRAPQPGRRIALELLGGYPFAQVFAPPGSDFICFEPMTAPTNALRSGEGLSVLKPGEEYRAAFRISRVPS
ncbi:MAG TPA: aldose 1-epimerase [Solirubrobacteraceae bacterium]